MIKPKIHNNEVFNDFLYKDGVLFWKRSKQGRNQLHIPAGSWTTYHNTHLIMYNKKLCRRSHLVWKYFHNIWPKKGIEHINRNNQDDRIENLREIDFSNAGFLQKNRGAVEAFRYITKVKNRKSKSFSYTFVINYRGVGLKRIKTMANLFDLVNFRNRWLQHNDLKRWNVVKEHEGIL